MKEPTYSEEHSAIIMVSAQSEVHGIITAQDLVYITPACQTYLSGGLNTKAL